MSEEIPFHLKGNFAPTKEEITALPPEVIGSIPKELRGIYARNGANPVTSLGIPNPRRDPVARVKLPQRVPYGFHGSWMPDL